MSPFMILFLFLYGILCLITTIAIDYDISNKDCVSPSLRWCVRLLFIFSSVIITSCFMIWRFDSWCFDKCAQYEGKADLKKQQEGSGTGIIFFINLFILVTMSISLSVLNNEPNCQISDTTRGLIITILVISSSFCTYGIFRASDFLKKTRKAKKIAIDAKSPS